MSQATDLPGYEELIGSLADRLVGLSALNQGLGEAAQSLVGAHRELAEAKRGIDRQTASTESMLEEVRRLQPAELGATLDASLSRLARDTTEGLGALSARLLTVANEAAATRERADVASATLERQLAVQDQALRDQLSALVASLTSSLDAAQRTLASSLASSHQATQGMLATMGKQQGDLAQRMESALTEIVAVRGVAGATQSTALAIRDVADGLGPAVGSALVSVRDDISAEIARARRTQILSMVTVLAALALAWAALEGFIPGV